MTSLSTALTLNHIRKLVPATPCSSDTDAAVGPPQKEVPDWVLIKYFKEYQTPELLEGFSRIDR